MTPTTPVSVAIEAFEMEDGDSWYIVGHVSEAEAVAAVNRCCASWGGEPFEVSDLCMTLDWWKKRHDPDDPGDDELWERCAVTDADSCAVTLVEL